VTLTNVDDELWKGITKADLILSLRFQIYTSSSERPALSLHIKHKGVNIPGKYIKDMEGRQPQCAEVFNTERLNKKKNKNNRIDYVVCNNVPTLIYVINLRCIDVNPWNSRTSSPNTPDYIVIGLDPSDDDFSKAIETARAVKQFFDEYRLKAFIKTSGKTGMHILVPSTAFDFQQARIIGKNICMQIHKLVPSFTTLEVLKEARGKKLFVDFSQNDYADAVASAYSVRPYKYPNVSTPMEWKELKTTLSPEEFSISTITKRLEKKGDLFISTLDEKIATKNNKGLKEFL
jgi:bifunctional non-homologous end joining protein LigD